MSNVVIWLGNFWYIFGKLVNWRQVIAYKGWSQLEVWLYCKMMQITPTITDFPCDRMVDTSCPCILKLIFLSQWTTSMYTWNVYLFVYFSELYYTVQFKLLHISKEMCASNYKELEIVKAYTYSSVNVMWHFTIKNYSDHFHNAQQYCVHCHTVIKNWTRKQAGDKVKNLWYYRW